MPAWHFWSFEEGGDGLSLCWAGTLTGPGDTQQDPVPGYVLITALASITGRFSLFTIPERIAHCGAKISGCLDCGVEVCSYRGGSESRELGWEAGQTHLKSPPGPILLMSPYVLKISQPS